MAQTLQTSTDDINLTLREGPCLSLPHMKTSAGAFAYMSSVPFVASGTEHGSASNDTGLPYAYRAPRRADSARLTVPAAAAAKGDTAENKAAAL